VDDFEEYESCDVYCQATGRTCIGAWDEDDNDCVEKKQYDCDEIFYTNDAICQCSETLMTTAAPVPAGTCADISDWPDHDLVCGECKVLVDDFEEYETCDDYCQTIGRTCIGAWDEDDNDCVEKEKFDCDKVIYSNDAICQCSGDASTSPSTGPSNDRKLVDRGSLQGLASTVSITVSLFLSISCSIMFLHF